MNGTAQYQMIEERLIQLIAKTARMEPHTLDTRENLIELGADSIILTDVNSYIREEFRVDIPLTLFFEELTSIAEIAAYIEPRYEGNSAIPAIPDSPAFVPAADPLPAAAAAAQAQDNLPPVHTPNQPFFPSPLQYQPLPPASFSPHPPGLPAVETGLTDLFARQLDIIHNQIQMLAGAAAPGMSPTKTAAPSAGISASAAAVAPPAADRPSGVSVVSAAARPGQGTASPQPYVAHKPIDTHKKKLTETQDRHIAELMERYTAKTQQSKAFAAASRLPYADWRNISGFRPAIKEMVYQLVFKHSRGSHITDIDGNDYIDLTMDFGASLFGHNEPFIKEAIAEEMDKGFPLSLITDLSGEVAELICEFTGNERVSFFNSGTEAVMVAMRLARAATGRDKIVLFSGAYHGTFDGVLGMHPLHKGAGAASPIAGGIPQSYVNDLFVLDYDDPESLAFIERHAGEIAAVLVEPVQSRRPDLQPRAFLHKLRDLTRQADIKLIFDEMILGFRMGPGGAQAFFGVQADLVTYGKIVGGGMPIGIVAGRSDVMNGIDGGVWNYGDDSVPPDEDRRTFAGGTFCHHPLAMAAAKAVLLRIKDEADTLYEPINRRTRFLAERLNTFFEANEVPIHIVYCGSLFRFMLRGNLEMFYYHLLDQGVYIWEGRNCFLSAAHTDDDIDRVIEAVEKTCLRMKGVFFGTKEKAVPALRRSAIALTAEQHKMLAFEALNPGTSAFHQSVRMGIGGEVDAARLGRAADIVAERHEALRCVLADEQPELRVTDQVRTDIAQRTVTAEQAEAEAAQLARLPFDLRRGPLHRIALLRIEGDDSRVELLFTAHHLALDGWSVSLFCEEWIAVYNALAEGTAAVLPEVVAYGAYAETLPPAAAFAAADSSGDSPGDRRHAADNRVRLPRSDSRSVRSSGRGERLTRRADEDLLRKVRKASAATKCSPFLFFLSAYQIALRTITGQRRFAVGVPVAGQQAFLPRALMGNCASILPVPVDFGRDTTLGSLAAGNREVLGQAAERIRAAHSGDEPARTLNVMFNMDRMPQTQSFAGTTLRMLPLPVDGVMYELFVNIVEYDGELVFDLDFDRDLYTSGTIERWFDLYLSLIGQLCQHPGQPLHTLSAYSAADEHLAAGAAEAFGYEALLSQTKFDPADYAIEAGRITARIVSEEALPAVTGSYGFLSLGPDRAERYTSNWLARIEPSGRLELAGPADDCFFESGSLYSPWRIAECLNAHPHLSDVCVTRDTASGEISAEFYSNQAGLTAEELIRWSLERLPRAVIPVRFCRRQPGAEPRLLHLQAGTSHMNDTELWLHGIVGRLLGHTGFGPDDNLISLGLQSLGLLRLVAEVQGSRGARIPLNELADSLTLRAVAAKIDAWTDLGGSESVERAGLDIPRVAEAEHYAASSAQQRMYILHGMNPDSLNYNMPALIEIEGDFDFDAFVRALNGLIDRHENLRTVFAEKDGEIVQLIRPALKLEVPRMTAKQGEAAEDILGTLGQSFVRPFDLNEGPLIRAAAVDGGPDRNWLLLDFHHIVFDGASSLVFARELMDLYENRELAPLRCQYKDFVAWQSERLVSEELLEQERFWSDRLRSPAPAGGIAADFARTDVPDSGGVLRFDTGLETKLEVERLCRAAGCTPFVFFLAVLDTVLSVHAGRPDLTVGTLVEGRSHPQLEPLIGMFVNTIPLACRIEAGQTFESLLRDLQRGTLEAFANADVPFDRIVELSGTPRVKNRNPLFDVLFSYQGFDELKLRSGGASFQYKELVPDDCKFDLEFEVVDRADGYQFVLQYSRGLYKAATVERMLGHVTAVMRRALAEPRTEMGALEIVTPEERREILTAFNRPAADLAAGDGLLPRFERWAEQTPEHPAVVWEDRRVSYRELNAEANRLARRLTALGLGREYPVGLMLDRSPEMVVCMLAVWKAGGAYIPVDAEHPLGRRLDLLEEAGCAYVICRDGADTEFADRFGGRILHTDSFADELQGLDDTNPGIVPALDQLAYILFTSGSTGKPKGVMIEHAGMINHILAERDMLGLGQELVFAQTAGHCFDISVWQLVGALALGGTTVIYSNELVLQPDLFLDRIGRDEVTLLEVVPSYLGVLMDLMQAQPGERFFCGTLGHLMITGESVRPDLAARWLSLRPDVPVVNAYGPAEASDDVAQYVTRDLSEIGLQLPIGRPLSNIRIYILDAQGRLCPVGVPGEICVAGIAVGRGYVGDPQRSRRSFAVDPYADRSPDAGSGEAAAPADRLYRTGDLGSWQPDGNLICLGRIDEQVKIRGHRIEPDEIEYALRQYPAVQDAAVAVRADASGDPCLCAYVITGSAVEPEDAARLREWLLARLPEYMVPAYFIGLEAFPLGATGKLDRRALPHPQAAAARVYMPPRNAAEERMLRIFKEVLGLSEAGVDENFFAIGGHSLRATRLINAIEKETGCRLSLKDVFAYPSAAELAALAEQAAAEPFLRIPPAERKTYYPMSPAQKRLFLIHEMEDLGTAYNMPGLLHLEGGIDAARIETAWAALIARHEALRTTFRLIDGVPMQQIAEIGASPLAKVEYADADNGVSPEAALREFVRPFDLAEGPLMRMQVVRIGDDAGFILFDMHHIVSDGATVNLIARDFARFYQGEIPEAVVTPYRDYSEWMRTLDLESERKYWSDLYADEVPRLDLPLDDPRGAVRSFEGNVYRSQLGRKAYDGVVRAAQAAQGTEYMVLLGAFMLLASKYAMQEDVVIGSPISGRTHPDLEHTAGIFVNTLALRGRPEAGKSWTVFLEEVKTACLQAYEHQRFPFEELVEHLGAERDLSRNPLFDLMFVMQNNEETEFAAESLRLGDLDADTGIAKFDLTLTVVPSADGCDLLWEYASALLRPETVERMARHFGQLLEAVLAEPRIGLGELEMLSVPEREQVLQKFNPPQADYPAGLTVKERFEEQVRLHPDRLAVCDGEERLTYRELNARANRIARQLLFSARGEGELVGLLLERSANMVAAILGAVKSGLAYVPIDPEAPADRMAYMLEDSGTRLLIHGRALADRIDGYAGEAWALEDMLESADGDSDGDNPSVPVRADSALYVIYTSGTTGNPKGTAVEHRNVISLLLSEAFPFEFDEHDVWSLFHLYTFDFSVWEMYGALLRGGRLVVVSKEATRDSAVLLDVLRRERVTVLNQVPSSFYELMHAEQAQRSEGAEPLPVKHLIFGGEALEAGRLDRFRQHYPDMNLVNMYGITETTVHVTYQPIGRAEIERSSRSIGRALPTLSLYVMNGSKLCGIGMRGEICVTGAGVARGYLNRPELTAQRFTQHPYKPDERMYRSGDLGRWLPDGSVEYLGRMDDQVKVRGYRIELGEIENIFRKQKGVRDVAVIIRKDRAGDPAICAYLVSDEQYGAFDPDEVRRQIARDLPSYMIPASIRVLDKMPITANGKLDRRALPEPEFAVRQAYTEPQGDKEIALADVFEQVLGMQLIGTDDNFFELGGDSIKAIRVVSKLRESGYDLSVRNLMMGRTIRLIADLVVPTDGAVQRYPQEPIEGEVALTPVQREFYGWKLEKPHHYNQSVMLHAAAPLDETVLGEALTALVRHHDMLRAGFAPEGLQSVRAADTQPSFDLSVFDLSHLGLPDAEDRIRQESSLLQSSIRLDAGPLLKAGLFRTSENDRLLIAIHHLVVDGVSWRILLEDLESAYRRIEQAEPVELPAKTASYAAWAEALREYAYSEELERELPYWAEIGQRSLALAVEQDSAAAVPFVSAEAFCVLSEEPTRQLLHEAGQAYQTQINDLLLTALGRSVKRWDGRTEILLELEGHGREAIHRPIEIDRTVGWFTSLFLVILRSDGEIGHDICATKETLRKIPNHGLGYGVIRHLRGETSISAQAEFCFNYLGQLDGEQETGRLLALSNEPSGDSTAAENRPPQPFTLNVSVLQGRLMMDMQYHPLRYTREKAESFAEIFRQTLTEIVEHCATKENVEYTASDFGDLDLEMDEFSEIMKSYT
ncbi:MULTISPECIES: non-ribosomal peptide synthetase [Saccharibacillus]|uniref:non-ribosomal peptide synthetase n=1 Tax=Saccharibacillus TaxID=456492 RepID=UPI00123C20FB|nr:non-ribosomal peptide synthetase [Saccharibacillus sp. WB 17]MWJ30255.1 amino acid adenylation domain-containing protein [Saccharibacillus sp. WB 17]